MFALALATIPAPPVPSPSVQVYPEPHTGEDARRACLLANRASDGSWPWPVEDCAPILAQRGVRAALGETLASRLDFLLAGDRARVAKEERRYAAARLACQRSWGCSGDVADSLRAWPRARIQHDGPSANKRGLYAAFEDCDGRPLDRGQVEEAYRAVLVGTWQRAYSHYGWVRGGYGMPPGSDAATPTPRGIIVSHRSYWTPDGASTALTILVPMDDEARQQMVWLEEMTTMRRRAHGAMLDIVEVLPLIASMTRPEGALGEVVGTALPATPEMEARWCDAFTAG